MYMSMEKEFKIIKKLEGHPNIIQGVDYFAETLRNRGYLVMEEVIGKNMLELVEEDGGVPEIDAKKIMLSIFDVLKYMHEKGVVHRDFNPTNAFLSKEGTVKVIDFNVSQLIEEDRHLLPQPSKFKYSMFTKTGTPLYSAPEIHTAFRYTEAVDLWGAGVILYLLITGECPFTEKK